MPAADESPIGLAVPSPDRSRLHLWLLATLILWVAAFAGILIYAVYGYQQLALVVAVLIDNDRYNLSRGDFIDAFFANHYGDVNSTILFRLWLTGWGLAALIKLKRLTPFPDRWTAFRDFSWLVVCTAAVAGFPLTALGNFGLDQLPPGWTLDIARLLLTPLIMPFAGLFSISVTATITSLLLASYHYLFLTLPLMIFEKLNDRDTQNAINGQKKRGLANQIGRFDLWLRGEQLPYVPDDSKGARFATPQEIVALHKPNEAAVMGFGHSGAPLLIKTDKHVLIMASTRSGKGVTLIIPHLLRYQGSAFVLDPKGENAKATIRQRRALNNQVHVLDPFGITGLPRARFNPLARFTPDNMEAESKALAAALFLVSERERDHWNAAGQQLLAAVILYVYVSADIPPERKDLPMVRKLLLGSLKETLNAMVEIDDADGLLRDLARSFLATPEREFGSVVSTAQRQTEILDNPSMIACLSASGPGEEVDFKAWHSGTMSVFLCLSAPKFPIFNRWLRLVLTSALDEMTDTLNPPPLPVCFMLDELATLGHLSSVENAVGLAAGYGIQLVNVFQDVAQMRDLYKGRWSSFIGNAGVRALFNLDDFDTAEYWSKFIGGRLTETRSTQQNIYGMSKGDNVGEAMRPLLPPDKLMMDFASGTMLVLAQGAHPIMTERVAYFDDEGLAGLWDDPRKTVQPADPSNWDDQGNWKLWREPTAADFAVRPKGPHTKR